MTYKDGFVLMLCSGDNNNSTREGREKTLSCARKLTGGMCVVIMFFVIIATATVLQNNSIQKAAGTFGIGLVVCGLIFGTAEFTNRLRMNWVHGPITG